MKVLSFWGKLILYIILYREKYITHTAEQDSLGKVRKASSDHLWYIINQVLRTGFSSHVGNQLAISYERGLAPVILLLPNHVKHAIAVKAHCASVNQSL